MLLPSASPNGAICWLHRKLPCMYAGLLWCTGSHCLEASQWRALPDPDCGLAHLTYLISRIKSSPAHAYCTGCPYSLHGNTPSAWNHAYWTDPKAEAPSLNFKARASLAPVPGSVFDLLEGGHAGHKLELGRAGGGQLGRAPPHAILNVVGPEGPCLLQHSKGTQESQHLHLHSKG